MVKRVTEAQLASIISGLSAVLSDIYHLGDEDECSVKHIAHALCAIRCGRKWDDVEDYSAPWGFDFPAAVTGREDDLKAFDWGKGNQSQDLAALWDNFRRRLRMVPREQWQEVFNHPSVVRFHGGYLTDTHISDMYGVAS